MTLQQTKLISKILTYRKTHTLAETGKKFSLTSERIRQIEHLKDRKRCKRHNRYYYNTCSHCLSDSYKTFLDKTDYAVLMSQCLKECRNRKRDYLSTWRRVYLVRILRDRYEKSFAEISKLLCRDYSTIKYLYKKV